MIDKEDPITLREYATILGISTKTALRKGKTALKQMIADKIKRGTLSAAGVEPDRPPKSFLDTPLTPINSDILEIVEASDFELLKTTNLIQDLDNNTKIHAHIVQNNAMKILNHYTSSLVVKLTNNPTQELSVFVARNIVEIVKTLAGK